MLLDYARLESIVANQKPYRGTENKYPLEDRKRAYKAFYQEELDGEKIFIITYGVEWIQRFITKDEYDALKLKTKRAYVDGGAVINSSLTQSSPKYYVYDKPPNKIGIMRPDNTFEFTGSIKYGMGQSIRAFISIALFKHGIYVFNSKKHGGAMVSYSGMNRYPGYKHPVFKGLRINIDTGEAITKYEVHRKVVIRKKVNEMNKPYISALKSAEVIISSMTKDTMLSLLKEVISDNNDNYINKSSGMNISIDLGPIIEEEKKLIYNVIDNPVDSLLVLMYFWNESYNYRQMIADEFRANNWTYRRYDHIKEIKKTIKQLKKKLCLSNEATVMEEIVYQAGEDYPSSEWGITVRIDGVGVEQYNHNY